MTTMTAPARATSVTREPRFAHLLRSEWIKFTSLPSMYLTLIALAVVGFGGSMFLAITLKSSIPPSTFNIETTMGDVTMVTVLLGQIMAGIIGVLCIGSEYSSGTITSTLLAAPTRLRALLAKAVLLFAVLTATGLVTVTLAWAATYPFYAEFGLQAAFGPQVISSLFGAAGYLGLCGMFGLGLGALLRSTTAGACLVFFATMLGPILSTYLPYGIVSRVVRLLLIGNAGDAMARVPLPDAPFLTLWSGHISPAAGWLIATVSASLALACGAVALLRRDA